MSDDGGERAPASWTGIGLILAIIGVLGLAELAAQLPASARKIGLFSVAFAITSGYLVGWIAADQRLSKGIAVLLTGGLVLAGLLLIGYRSFDQLRSARMAALQNASGEGFDRMIVNQLAAEDPDLMQTSFTDYLSFRIGSLGQWPQPWPAVFWGAEVVLGSLAGAFVVHRRLTSAPGESNLAA